MLAKVAASRRISIVLDRFGVFDFRVLAALRTLWSYKLSLYYRGHPKLPLLSIVVDKAENPPQSEIHAQVAELVDALVSGTSGESRGGSSPLLGTTANKYH
jgi:hypothetical protein